MSASLERPLCGRILPPETALPLQRAKLAGLAVAAAAVTMLFANAGATPAYAAPSLQNPGLEVDANGNSIPDCWQKGGYGSNKYAFTRTADAHSGLWAERLRITSLSSGDRKLVTSQDSGACALSVAGGQTYKLGAWYKSDVATRFVVYLRGLSGGWNYWTSGPALPASGTWAQASWTTPPVPSGQTLLSFGLNLTRAGSLTTDDYGFANATSTTGSGGSTTTDPGSSTPTDTTPPDTSIATHPADPTTATTASFSFTSTEANSTFRCTLDGAATACASPKTSSALADGSHSFRVAATDPAGNTDPTPATFDWSVQPPVTSSCGKQTDWVAPQVQQSPTSYLYTPMSDAAAAACVTDVPESVAANAAANAYVPSDGELQTFRSALTENKLTSEQEEWYPRYVTGRPGIANPSTDELIQWAAHKWGIPEDWLRAQYTQESDWRQSELGDLRTESSAWWGQFPSFSCPTSAQCYESLGLTQVKWHPDGSEGAGTEPLRWKSTAFNVDYQASIIRFEYDNPYGKRSSWGDASYHPLDQWLALGAWFSCYPYNNAGQQDYISKVKAHLAARDWPR